MSPEVPIPKSSKSPSCDEVPFQSPPKFQIPMPPECKCRLQFISPRQCVLSPFFRHPQVAMKSHSKVLQSSKSPCRRSVNVAFNSFHQDNVFFPHFFAKTFGTFSVLFLEIFFSYFFSRTGCKMKFGEKKTFSIPASSLQPES